MIPAEMMAAAEQWVTRTLAQYPAARRREPEEVTALIDAKARGMYARATQTEDPAPHEATVARLLWGDPDDPDMPGLLSSDEKPTVWWKALNLRPRTRTATAATVVLE